MFETLKVDDGGPFALRRHLERLRTLGRGLGLDDPAVPTTSCAAACAEPCSPPTGGRRAAAHHGHRRRRPARLGAAATARRRSSWPASPAAAWPATSQVVVVPWARNERGASAGLKTISYAENVVALAHAREQGADEAIFANTAGDAVRGHRHQRVRRVRRPAAHAAALDRVPAGVTRELVLELIDVDGDRCRSRWPTWHGADEAFLTSTTREVQPIAAVDGAPLPAARARYDRSPTRSRPPGQDLDP